VTDAGWTRDEAAAARTDATRREATAGELAAEVGAGAVSTGMCRARAPSQCAWSAVAPKRCARTAGASHGRCRATGVRRRRARMPGLCRETRVTRGLTREVLMDPHTRHVDFTLLEEMQRCESGVVLKNDINGGLG